MDRVTLMQQILKNNDFVLDLFYYDVFVK